MSIENFVQKIKLSIVAVKESFKGEGTKEKYFTVFVIILVGASSFGLGRLSAIDEQRQPVTIEKNTNQAEKAEISGTNLISSANQSASVIGSVKANISTQTNAGGKFVASRNGAKYYFPWCGGASKIAEANKIWFNSEADARAKGYTPAANCKGLR